MSLLDAAIAAEVGLPAAVPVESTVCAEGVAASVLASCLDVAIAAELDSPDAAAGRGASKSHSSPYEVDPAAVATSSAAAPSILENAIAVELGEDAVAAPGTSTDACAAFSSRAGERPVHEHEAAAIARQSGIPGVVVHGATLDAQTIASLPEEASRVLREIYSAQELVAVQHNIAEHEVAHALGISVTLLRQYGVIRRSLQALRIEEGRRRLLQAAQSTGLETKSLQEQTLELRLAIDWVFSNSLCRDACPDELEAAKARLRDLEADVAAQAQAQSQASLCTISAAAVEAACAAIIKANAAGDSRMLQTAVADARKLGVPKRDIARANALGQV